MNPSVHTDLLPYWITTPLLQGIYMLMSVVSEVTSKIGLHNSRASQSLQRCLLRGPAWGSSIANTPANTSTSSSVGSLDASGAWASNSSHSRSPSDAPKLPLPSLSNLKVCEVTSEGEGGRGSGADPRRSSSSIGGLRDLMHGGGESKGRFSSFSSSTFGGSGNLLGGGVQQQDGEASDRVRAASEGVFKVDNGMPPGDLAASGRMTKSVS
eukprot:1150539-Pelagomonas_calceolata.AAC.2